MSDLDERAVEAAARAIATEFGYEWVFEWDATEENYDAAYWRHVAEGAFAAYFAALDPEAEIDRVARWLYERDGEYLIRTNYDAESEVFKQSYRDEAARVLGLFTPDTEEPT